MKTGAKILIESLLREGVETIFGYPGGQILPVYDELYDSPLRTFSYGTNRQQRMPQTGMHAQAVVWVFASQPQDPEHVILSPDSHGLHGLRAVVAITGQVPTYMLGKRRVPGIGYHRH